VYQFFHAQDFVFLDADQRRNIMKSVGEKKNSTKSRC